MCNRNIYLDKMMAKYRSEKDDTIRDTDVIFRIEPCNRRNLDNEHNLICFQIANNQSFTCFIYIERIEDQINDACHNKAYIIYMLICN